MSDYEEGYKDGMAHITSQVKYLNDHVSRIADILTRAIFVSPANKPPKPNINLWLILPGEIITTGYYMKGEYIADSGAIVEPTHWCMPPTVVANCQRLALGGV